MAGEPNLDAPENYWIGQYDAQQIADTIGMSWAQPLFALHQTRMVNIPELCAADPPSAPAFTTADLAFAVTPFIDNSEQVAKLKNVVDAYAWTVFCHKTDATPEPDPPSQLPPADAPPNLPGQPFDYLPDIWRWLEWMRRQFHPLSFYQLHSYDLEGVGQMSFPANNIGDWQTRPMGVNIHVTAKPDYSGRSGGGDPPVMYDLGWFSLGNSSHFEQPIRLQREHQIATTTFPADDFAWNLAPGVTITVSVLYPGTTQEGE